MPDFYRYSSIWRESIVTLSNKKAGIMHFKAGFLAGISPDFIGRKPSAPGMNPVRPIF